MSKSVPFLPPVVAAWENAGSKLATGEGVDPEAFLDAVEKLAPIADSLGRVYSVEAPTTHAENILLRSGV